MVSDSLAFPGVMWTSEELAYSLTCEMIFGCCATECWGGQEGVGVDARGAQAGALAEGSVSLLVRMPVCESLGKV